MVRQIVYVHDQQPNGIEVRRRSPHGQRGRRSPGNGAGLSARNGSAQKYSHLKRALAARVVHIDDRDYAKRQLEKARWLWQRRRPAQGSLVETYLRRARGYTGALSTTLGFLPPLKSEHQPAMIAAFALAGEPEPAVLRYMMIESAASISPFSSPMAVIKPEPPTTNSWWARRAAGQSCWHP